MESSVSATAKRLRGRDDWLSLVKAEYPKPPSVKGAERTERLRAIAVEIKTGRTAYALALARLLAWAEPALFLREARRMGLFRASKYTFRGEGAAYIVANLLQDATAIGWSESEQRYLNSVLALLSLAPAASAARRALVATLRKKQRVVLKSCLVCVDRAFRPPVDQVPDAETLTAQALGHPSVFSPAQKASGLSTIVALMRETVGITPLLTRAVDERGIASGVYEGLLQDAARLGLLHEAEVLVDAFPYAAEATHGVVTVYPLDDRLEQSVRLGYVQMGMQLHIRRQATFAPELAGVVSLEDCALDFYKHVGTQLIQRKTTPADRYVMTLPMIPQIIGVLSNERLYREEVPYLHGLAVDAFMKFSELEQVSLFPGVKILDLLKVQRFFAFTAAAFFEALDQPVLDGDRDELDMRSRIPVYPVQMLTELLGEIVGSDVAARVIKLLSFDADDPHHFDIQYTPLLRIGDYFMTSMSVLVASNLVRNALCRQSARLLPAGGADPMQSALSHSLATAGFLVAAEIERTIDGETMEVDLVAYREGNLFLLECKNAFHPTDPHEMRTSYGHIEKAARQLGRSCKWLSSLEAQAKLFEERGRRWPRSETVQSKKLLPSSLLFCCPCWANSCGVRFRSELCGRV